MNKIIAIFSFCLLQIFNLSAQNNFKEITLDDIYRSGKFTPEYVYGMRPLNDGEHYCMMQEDSLNVYSYKTGDRTETLVTA
ncbi:MAG: hypothetical protein B6D61_00820, partial [Bacteroidetes bacterium 4484_249]